MRFLFTLLLLVSSLVLFAQTKTTKVHRVTSTHQAAAEDGTKKHVHSESFTSHSKNSYQFTADFVAGKYERLKAVLFEQLGREKAVPVSEEGLSWRFQNVRGRYCYVELYPRSIKVNLDRTIATSKEYRDIEKVGEALQAVVATHDNSTNNWSDPYAPGGQYHQQPAASKEARLQRALEELEAARRKVEKIKQEGGEE